MSNFSKIVIIILLVLSFFFIKEKYGNNFDNLISFPEIKNGIHLPKINLNNKDKNKDELVKKPTEVIVSNHENNERDVVNIYFLALDSDGNGIYKKVQRELPSGENKFEYSIKELLKGPNIVEKSTGAYTEIPKTAKLLGIKQHGNKIIVNFNSDFQYGGGTDSIYSRMMQLIKTSIANSKDKKIYLYIDGKQVNCLGGEGIMISQPLNEKSLEV